MKLTAKTIDIRNYLINTISHEYTFLHLHTVDNKQLQTTIELQQLPHYHRDPNSNLTFHISVVTSKNELLRRD